MGRTLLLHYITQISHVWQLSQHSSLIIILYATYLGACFRFYNYKCVDSSSSNFLLRMQHKCQSASLSGGILVPRAHSVILWTWRPLYIYKVLNFVGKPSERHCNFFEYIPSSRIWEHSNIHGFTSSILHTELMQDIPGKHMTITPEFKIISLQVYS